MSAPTLTQDVSGNPWVEVFFDPGDLHADAARITIYRESDNRIWKVRGGVDIAVGTAALDFEAPLGVSVTYRAEQFDAAGASLGYTETASITLDVEGTWLHNPLEPTLGAPVEIDEKSLSDVGRPTPGSRTHTEGESVPRRIGGRRRGVEGVPIVLNVDGLDRLRAVEAMLGGYDDSQTAVLCLRTTEPVLWPKTFFFASELLAWRDRTYRFSGDWAQLVGTVDEVKPPYAGLVLPLLTYDDLDAAYDDYDERDAAYATYTEQDRDYTLAGLAG